MNKKYKLQSKKQFDKEKRQIGIGTIIIFMIGLLYITYQIFIKSY